jgi:predicted small lipoprotein YifL
MEKLIRKAIFFAIFAALIVSLSACGKKGPPLPPSSSVPPEVAGLKITLEENLMTLTWRVAAHGEEADTLPAGFFVYRSRSSLSAPACENCPLRFEKAADIPVENAQIRTTYTEFLEKGFRYVYKVSSYADSGSESELSEVVAVEFPSQQKIDQ